jgi:hypothetical protein
MVIELEDGIHFAFHLLSAPKVATRRMKQYDDVSVFRRDLDDTVPQRVSRAYEVDGLLTVPGLT